MSRKKIERTVCACEKCQNACEHVPGWFRPGEAEKAAKYLGMSLPKFFKKYLGVNWWVGSSKNVYVLAPATVEMDAGSEYPGNPRGRCVFFKGGRCEIHAVKPFECSHGNPCQQDSYEALAHEREHVTVKLWADAKCQRQIVTLLGHRPKPSAYSILDHFASMLG